MYGAIPGIWLGAGCFQLRVAGFVFVLLRVVIGDDRYRGVSALKKRCLHST